MAQWAPVFSVLIAALFGFATYLFQKIRDRKEDLIKTRRSEYRKWIQALYDALAAKATGDAEAVNDFNKTTNELFLFGSDDVIRAAGVFKAYMSHNAHLEAKVAGRLLAVVIQEMRTDCFEKTRLTVEDITDILPMAAGSDTEEES